VSDGHGARRSGGLRTGGGRRNGRELHPALEAWRALGRTGGDPAAVETLKDRRKCSVYRLDGAAPDGGAIVAKRTRRRLAVNEHALYTYVLPRLPLPALRSHGVVDRGPDACWVFVDHCDGVPFSATSAHHRTLAARWLATMHLHGPEIARDVRLPDRGLATYLAHLRSAQERIRRRLGAPVLGGDRGAVLDEVLARCDALAGGWAELEATCGRLPPTVVHADAKPANLMVRSRAGGDDELVPLELVPLDWAEAGWGVPVVDLTQVDGPAYWETIGTAWGDGAGAHRRLSMTGLTLRWIVGIDKVSACLDDPSYVDRAMDHMTWFLEHLDRTRGDLGSAGGLGR
jgi:hypothetical protein